MNIDINEIDCAVCLQKCHHPTQLPCGHIFCFLCVKGVTIQNKKCAMCRAEIPSDYLEHPVLLGKLSSDEKHDGNVTEEYHWYYEGRNGWWKYDERSNTELETAFNAGEGECVLLLAGALYCINFQNMIQVRRTDPSKRRRVRRDLPTLPAKGIAGIKIPDIQRGEHTKAENENNPVTVETRNDLDVIESSDEEIVSENIDGQNTEIHESENILEPIGIIVQSFSALHVIDEESSADYQDTNSVI